MDVPSDIVQAVSFVEQISKIHNGLASHTTHVVCVNFIQLWRNSQFKVVSERQIFEKLFMAFIFTLRVFARNLLRGSRWRNIFFHISFWCLTWGLNLGLSSNKPTLYLLIKYLFLYFSHPPNLFYLTKTFFFFTLRTHFWITQTFLTRFLLVFDQMWNWHILWWTIKIHQKFWKFFN